MSSTVVLLILLVVVAVGAWLIWRPRGLAIPARLRDDPPNYDLNALVPPYRDRFGALLNRPVELESPQRHALLKRAYALASEGSALTARLHAGARTAEFPVEGMDTVQEQYHEMRERRDSVNAELAVIEAQYGA